MWVYQQSTGKLMFDGDTVVSHGYSGHGDGKNNPAAQGEEDVGPIPVGVYSIGDPHDTDSHGPHVMALTPEPGTDTLGRGGFLIHGDSIAHPGEASHGCIILDHSMREMLGASDDRQIEVIA